MIIARQERRVEWGDCDPARIVFNPRYFEWFDAQTALVFETAGFSKRDLLRRLDFAGFPLGETKVQFLRPSRFGDTVVIESNVAAFRKSSFDVQHRLFNHGALAVEGFETRVWAARDPGDPEKIKSHPSTSFSRARRRGAVASRCAHGIAGGMASC
jgi:4-hydroxybenzoyl-CoA thioesterase